MENVTLETPLVGIIGDRTATVLERAFEMHTVEDLLMHFPRRYSKRGELSPLKELPIGEHITVVAEVLEVRERRMQRRNGSLIEARITDGEGFLTITFFNQKWRLKDLQARRRGVFSGKVSEYRGALQLQQPDYELFEHRDDAPGGEALSEAAAKAWSQVPVPLYPATGQAQSWAIHRAIGVVLDQLDPVPDPLPMYVVATEGLMSFDQALRLVHQPEVDEHWQQARQSLLFREAFELQLALLDRRRRVGLAPAMPREKDGELLTRFDGTLPFTLTGDQQRAGETIANDLADVHPMHRLLQGEVGSGKTLVALRAMLQVAEDGGQSALLSPTEVLASQHFRSINESLGPDLAAEVGVVLLTGRMPAAERKKALLALASGAARIAIGTHALLGDKVSMYDLGLVVIDEQHRFGVDQREALRKKGNNPHTLAMTATPIPRTVALTAFGDLEVSTIKELPAGRQGIKTVVVHEEYTPDRKTRMWQEVFSQLEEGRQIYFVCPAIDQTELDPELDAEIDGPVAAHTAADANAPAAPPKPPVANVTDTVALLRRSRKYEGIRVEGMYGSMPTDEKDRIMQDFASGDIGILVSTTVIEVGVNVPNASMMIVRNADRFGISQLHQLRGRVGRGQHAGRCLLLTSAEEGTPALERLLAVAATTDGFQLAEADLEQRREGDILGTRQSGGRSTLRLLRVTEHGELIVHAREVAADLLDGDPLLEQYPLLASRIAAEESHIENLAKS
ncbi:ATP-dependent DNA helicase RecG [Leucobacter exalbidus]|uniref:Probable DNA 3'-5' helicase RecG n=1 Tax=Leucobacter exalbidus TaxID=662960 RepID=A0A940PP10_9MICO|nr:ATP-dependent DNA helicase RecG [Leucobacter exalbidus]MBP1324949.1 ATP-dependent DNA helicase RecG [Leucobacter exalbidus]